jgi:hypothetical protein
LIILKKKKKVLVHGADVTHVKHYQKSMLDVSIIPVSLTHCT